MFAILLYSFLSDHFYGITAAGIDTVAAGIAFLVIENNPASQAGT